jgi:hypothetical protein
VCILGSGGLVSRDKLVVQWDQWSVIKVVYLENYFQWPGDLVVLVVS